MVRFIINISIKNLLNEKYLHSNMVRFIMRSMDKTRMPTMLFTFQYGQIYYNNKLKTKDNLYNIYIPIWLDLLQEVQSKEHHRYRHLHSNMVRFIIRFITRTYIHGRSIYIPIWLDLLSRYRARKCCNYFYLHSNMVRFIINFYAGTRTQ